VNELQTRVIRRHRRAAAALAGLLAAALATGCATHASQPAPAPAYALHCGDLNLQISRAERDKQEAQQTKDNAWKAVVPFVVAGRYIESTKAANQADERLGQLRLESARKGCAPELQAQARSAS
jgi:hypothetical protein